VQISISQLQTNSLADEKNIVY